VLRYHYGLVVPEDSNANGGAGLNMALNVDGHQIRWQNRKAFLFDDTYAHCAFNHTDRQRIILFLDIIRPMPQPFSTMNRSLNAIFLASQHMQQAKQRMAAPTTSA
jgi:aspartyl/asparaginyl beta-hydroxylase (cupin superfamily)